MITITNKIDMSPGKFPVVIHLGQYDDDFTLVFQLFSSVGTFTIQSGTTAEIRGTKVDGNGYSASCSISGNDVTVTGNNQMTAVAGFNTFELVLKKSDKVLSTANFIIDVERAAMDADTIESDTVLKELNTIIAGATTATEAAERAEAYAEEALGVSEEAREALLACFAHVAWIDDSGQSLYNSLAIALTGTLDHISATFNSGNNYVYTDDTLESLKQYLTVTAHYSNGLTQEVTDYTLSGTLVKGTSTITVTFSEKTTSVTISDVIDFYDCNTWVYTNGGKNNLIRANRGAFDLSVDGSAKGVFCQNSDSPARRGFYTNRGLAPAQTETSKTPTTLYPIPVPPAATKATAAITPNTAQISLYIFEYIDDQTLTDYHYKRHANPVSWQTGTAVLTFTAKSNLFIAMNCREASTGDIINEPEMQVVFE